MIILDPCVGDGAISTVLARRLPDAKIVTNDIDPRFPANFHEDYTSPDFWHRVGPVDWVVANPAFSTAGELLACAWPLVTLGVILHVRVTFMEPLKKGLRRNLLRQAPPTHVLWLPRVRYQLNAKGKSGSDSTACAWMVWTTVKAFLDDELPPLIAPNTYAPESLIDFSSTYRPPADQLKTAHEFYRTPEPLTEWLCDVVFP